LVADQSSLQASMLRGGQTIVEFTVSNYGAIASGKLNISLPNAPWLKSASTVTLPSLNPGESTKVSLLLQPSETQELTVYNGNVVIAGDEASLSLPFQFRAVSEAKGELNINVVDELFFFAEGSPKLANATISLLDPFTGRVVFSETDADGVFSKNDLLEGYYTLQITANNHDTYRQNVYIGAGETEDVQAFLSRQTVRYSWTVTPTEIEDRYTISVQSTFETDVPVPVVVFDPPVINLSDLQAVGQIMQVDMKVTNHGLIAANDIKLNFGEHPFYKIEPLINDVDILAAKSSLTIPIRITRIANFDTLQSNAEINALSSPSVPCSISASGTWSFLCGLITVGKSSSIPVNGVEGNCGGTSLPGGIPGGGISGGGIPGGGSSFVYSSTPITTEPCFNQCPCPEFNLSLDLSDFFEGPIKAAEAVVNTFLKGRAEVELDVEAKVHFESCCEEDTCDRNLDIKISGNAEVSAEVVFGPNISVDFDQDLDLELDVPLGIIKEIEIDGEVSLGITGTPSISISGSATKDCDGELEVVLKGEIAFDFQAGASGEVDIRAILYETDGDIEFLTNVEGEGKAGLFGNISYTFGYSTSQGFYSCLQSEGLYLTAFVDVFGYNLSLFKDNPFTSQDESKRYLIDPVECVSSSTSFVLALSGEEPVTLQTGELSLKNLEVFLDKRLKNLYKNTSKSLVSAPK
jgi:hypothetical protein